MSRRLPVPTPRSRYSYRTVVGVIRAELGRRPLGEQREVALAAGLDESGFAHRLAGKKSRFTLEQLGCIADHWRMPPGWPLVTRSGRRVVSGG